MSVGVYDALRSAVVRESWELDSAKVGVLAKGERIAATRRRWISADTARLHVPGRGWVSNTASDGRRILAQLRFRVRRPLPVYRSAAAQPEHRLDSLLVWTDAVMDALALSGAEDAVELKLTPAVHGGHRRGWVAAHGLELLPPDQLAAGPPTVGSAGSPAVPQADASPAFAKTGRWTALPTAPSAGTEATLTTVFNFPECI